MQTIPYSHLCTVFFFFNKNMPTPQVEREKKNKIPLGIGMLNLKGKGIRDDRKISKLHSEFMSENEAGMKKTIKENIDQVDL